MHMTLDGALGEAIETELRRGVFPSLSDHFPLLADPSATVHMFLYHEVPGAASVRDGAGVHNDLFQVTLDITLNAKWEVGLIPDDLFTQPDRVSFAGGGFDVEGGGFLPHLAAGGVYTFPMSIYGNNH
jgi:hypothetical protein